MAHQSRYLFLEKTGVFTDIGDALYGGEQDEIAPFRILVDGNPVYQVVAQQGTLQGRAEGIGVAPDVLQAAPVLWRNELSEFRFLSRVQRQGFYMTVRGVSLTAVRKWPTDSSCRNSVRKLFFQSVDSRMLATLSSETGTRTIWPFISSAYRKRGGR